MPKSESQILPGYPRILAGTGTSATQHPGRAEEKIFWKIIPIGIFLYRKSPKAMNKAEKTRQFIVEKTAPVFNKKGYAGTSISDMTEATGLTKGSIYGNFANKDEVALAAFDYNVKKVTSMVRAEIDKKKTVREKLLVYVDVYSGNIQGFPEGGCPILNTAVEADDTHEALKKKVVDVILDWKNFIVSLLQTGIEKKEFKEIKDPEQTALSIISTIEGGIMISRVTGRPRYIRQVMEQVEKMIRELK